MLQNENHKTNCVVSSKISEALLPVDAITNYLGFSKNLPSYSFGGQNFKVSLKGLKPRCQESHLLFWKL